MAEALINMLIYVLLPYVDRVVKKLRHVTNLCCRSMYCQALCPKD